jgi:hypothetical protein
LLSIDVCRPGADNWILLRKSEARFQKLLAIASAQLEIVVAKRTGHEPAETAGSW